MGGTKKASCFSHCPPPLLQLCAGPHQGHLHGSLSSPIIVPSFPSLCCLSSSELGVIRSPQIPLGDLQPFQSSVSCPHSLWSHILPLCSSLGSWAEPWLFP